MLVVENLVKQYGELTAVDDVSFEAQPGTVFGRLGPNGAGKSLEDGVATVLEYIGLVARDHRFDSGAETAAFV